MIYKFLKILEMIPGARFLYRSVRVFVVCIFRPSSDGPWPLIPFSRHVLLSRSFFKFVQSNQHFGGGRFYQSFEPLGITGLRPTANRAERYKINRYLSPQSKVLDIGANTGFFSMYIADCVAHIDAIEIDDTLVSIGREIAAYAGIGNLQFLSLDIKRFEPSERYDVIFAFAVHNWASKTIDEFSELLKRLSKPGAIVFFESNSLLRDREFDMDVQKLCGHGFEVVDTVETVYECPRRLVVLRYSVPNDRCEARV